ncbi:PREDICTED: double-stranded RNA-binding protein 1-like [Nelumbo nucifera]|uniref:Double-stranded RNA-binding protein 1-like n=1 Tax=Nelumbo nucifera TaxID=4432 RepID=A0A1U8QBV0_NELNU|nr:PREDICTED: double-stranded RNA-binding protein 1-like [Nelumbo nucifera]
MDPPFKPSFPENLMHKNRLHEYAQKSAIPLPVYSSVNEGAPHAPKFRSTVLIDGETYTSFRTFSNRKAAEHDVAKVAYEHIQKKIKESCPIILEDLDSKRTIGSGREVNGIYLLDALPLHQSHNVCRDSE